MSSDPESMEIPEVPKPEEKVPKPEEKVTKPEEKVHKPPKEKREHVEGESDRYVAFHHIIVT